MRKFQILLLVFFIGTALSIIVTSVLMFRISGRAEMLRLVEDLRYKLETTAMAFNDYLITGDEECKKEFDEGLKEVQGVLDDLEKMSKSEDEKALIDK